MRKSILLSMALCLCIAMQTQSQNKLVVNADQSNDLRWQNGTLHLGDNVVGKLAGEMTAGIVVFYETFITLGDNT
jgi:hypothetical protein